MPLAPIPDGAPFDVIIHGRAFGQDVVNCLAYHVTTNGTNPVAATILDFASAFRDVWVDTVMPLLSDAYELVSIEYGVIDSVYAGPPPVPYYSTHINLPELTQIFGGVTGAPLPSMVTASVRKVTAGDSDTDYYPDDPAAPISEKVFRGRTGLGPLAEANTRDDQGNQLIADLPEDISLALDNIIVVGFGADWVASMIVVSLARNGVVRLTAGAVGIAAFQSVITLVCNGFVGSQTTRKQRNSA